MSPQPRPVADVTPVASPCTSVCTIDQRSGLCAGCYRSLEEIAGWTGYTDDERRAVIAGLAARRQQEERR